MTNYSMLKHWNTATQQQFGNSVSFLGQFRSCLYVISVCAVWTCSVFCSHLWFWIFFCCCILGFTRNSISLLVWAAIVWDSTIKLTLSHGLLNKGKVCDHWGRQCDHPTIIWPARFHHCCNCRNTHTHIPLHSFYCTDMYTFTWATMHGLQEPTYCPRQCSVSGPGLWNKLPVLFTECVSVEIVSVKICLERFILFSRNLTLLSPPFLIPALFLCLSLLRSHSVTHTTQAPPLPRSPPPTPHIYLVLCLSVLFTNREVSPSNKAFESDVWDRLGVCDIGACVYACMCVCWCFKARTFKKKLGCECKSGVCLSV